MKKKIIGIFICTLLITTILPITGTVFAGDDGASGASGDDVVRPNLSIGAVPRNFYGPTTGVLPRPPGTVTNGAVSPYNSATGVLNTPNKVWTVSIGGNAESYVNLPSDPPGNAADTATYIGGGSAADTSFYYPNPGVNY